MSSLHEKALDLIVDVEDFPKDGVVFKDITPLLASTHTFRYAVNRMVDLVGPNVDKIAAIDARGFILGGAMAHESYSGFVPIRKAGKLPRGVFTETCALEYGAASLSVHKSEIRKGDKIVIVDDVLATGGTARAACKLVEACGAKVDGVIFLVEISALKGRRKLEGYRVESVFRY